MIFSFESIKNKMKKLSSDKVKNVIYAMWEGNSILVLLIVIFLMDIITGITSRFGYAFSFFCIFIILISMFVYLRTRRCSFALCENMFFYAKFKHFKFEAKDIYDIPFDKIRYLDVKKRLFGYLVKMTFISNDGKLTKLRFRYQNMIIGLSVDEQKKNAEIITNRLMEIQKVLDKGDF